MDNIKIVKQLQKKCIYSCKLILTRPELLLNMWKILLMLLSLSGLSAKVPSKFKTLQCVAIAKEFGEFKNCEIKAINRNKNIININYLVKKKIDDFEV